MAKLSRAVAAAGLLLIGLGNAATDTEPITPVHEAGRCAIRGHCGSKGFFGKPLPCPDNGRAEEPDEELRDQLVDFCGPKWSSGPVCCDLEQVRDTEQLGIRAGDGRVLVEACQTPPDEPPVPYQVVA